MDTLNDYFNSLSNKELRRIRKSLFRSLKLSRNQPWSMLLSMIDNLIVRNAFDRADQSTNEK